MIQTTGHLSVYGVVDTLDWSYSLSLCGGCVIQTTGHLSVYGVVV